MKRGFTLVELLAVIVILSVIAIITVPIIGNVIEESRKKALEQSAYGLVSAADYYVVDKLEEKDYHFVFENGKQTSSDKLDYKGKIDVDGDLYIDKNGDISLCIYNNKYYVIKRNNGGIEIGEKTEERNCAIRPVNGKYVAYLTDDGTGDYATLSDLNSIKSELETQISTNTLQIAENAENITTLSNKMNEILVGPSRNSIYLERDITADFDNGTFSTNVANGTFQNIQPGAYINKTVTIGGTNYNIKLKAVDLDLFYGGYNQYPIMNTHHVAFLVLGLPKARMNSTNTTEGGYKGSEMYTTTLPTYLTALKSAIGASHFVSHQALISNSVNTSYGNKTGGNNGLGAGATDGWEWVNVEIILPTEMQMYGGTIFSSSGCDTGEAFKQFSATKLVPYYRIINEYYNDPSWIWLRDITSNSCFTAAVTNGIAHFLYSSNQVYVAPLILLK